MLFQMIVLTAFCQKDINYKEILKDLAKLDSCIETTINKDKIIVEQNNFISAKNSYIEYQKKQIDDLLQKGHKNNKTIIKQSKNLQANSKKIVKQQTFIKYLGFSNGIFIIILVIVLI